MLVKERIAVKFFEEIKCDVRLIFFDGLEDRAQLAPNPNRTDFVSHPAQRCDHVILGAPLLALFGFDAIERFGRNQVFTYKGYDSKLPFGLIYHNAIL